MGEPTCGPECYYWDQEQCGPNGDDNGMEHCGGMLGNCPEKIQTDACECGTADLRYFGTEKMVGKCHFFWVADYWCSDGGEMRSEAAGNDGASFAIPEGLVHLVTVADAATAKAHAPQMALMRKYAAHHGYSWTVLSGAKGTTSCARHGDAFLRHCVVAEWVEKLVPEGHPVFAFDPDTVPHRAWLPLTNWLEDLALPIATGLIERADSRELAVSTYYTMNSAVGLEFVRTWSEYWRLQPRGYSGSDAGALLLHVLREAGEEPPANGACGRLYRQLDQSEGRKAYESYVSCTRRSIAPGVLGGAEGRIRLFDAAAGWSADPADDSHVADGDEGPVFHSGVSAALAMGRYSHLRLLRPGSGSCGPLCVYWDREQCGPNGDDHGMETCGGQEGHCPDQIDAPSCDSGVAALTFYGTDVSVGGCSFFWLADYACAGDKGAPPAAAGAMGRPHRLPNKHTVFMVTVVNRRFQGKHPHHLKLMEQCAAPPHAAPPLHPRRLNLPRPSSDMRRTTTTRGTL